MTHPVCLLLLYRSSRTPVDVFLCQLSNFLMTFTIDIVLGDFNINALEAPSRLENVMCDFQLIVDSATHIDGGLLDHVYVHKNLTRSLHVQTLQKCVNISDHNAIKIKLSLKEADKEIDCEEENG